MGFLNKKGIGTSGIVLIAAMVAGAVVAGGYMILSDGDDAVEVWVAPYVPEQYGKEPQYHYASELLDNPNIYNAIEVSLESGSIKDSSDELKELPPAWGDKGMEGKGKKYEVEPGTILEVTVDKMIEDYTSAGLGKGGDVEDEDEWYEWVPMTGPSCRSI